MKTLSKAVLLIGIFLAGCQQPQDIEVIPEPGVEVTPLADSTLLGPSIDSSGVLPRDQQEFAGQVVLNQIVFDTGNRTESFAYSRVYFADRSRPIFYQGFLVGFPGIDLGSVLLNGDLMDRRPHRIRMRRAMRDTVAGVEYVRDMTSTYLPRTSYTWTATPPGLGTVNISLQTPDDLRVLAPAGGSVLSRSEDLELRWTGRGPVIIVLSSYSILERDVRPLFHIRPGPDANRLLLSSKVLRALPRSGVYVLTFIRAHRNETTVVTGYPGRILGQAASLYNVYVEIR